MQDLVKIGIENQNGKLVVSSRVIAEQLGKRHDNVVRDLEKILENSNVSSLIIPSTYKVDGQNREYKEYLLTKDGFTLYMFNIQGHNNFKLAYINRFNEMERALQNQFKVPTTFKEALQLALEQQEIIEKQAPKVEYYDEVLQPEKLVATTEIAKDLGMSAVTLHNKLHDLGVIYKKGKTWLLYEKYQKRVPEYCDYSISKYGQTLKWSEKGREWIINMIKGVI